MTTVIHAHTISGVVQCPSCGCCAGRVHSRYERQLDHAAIAGKPVLIRLRVRRFFCDNDQCRRQTFAEQVDGLTTPLLRGMLQAIALALAGRAGARLTEVLAMPASRSMLPRLIRALPDPRLDPVPVLSVDDFALRHRHVYGTVLVDLQTHRPVDLLPDRTASGFARWLADHPGTRVICRDRAGAYAEAASSSAPWPARSLIDGICGITSLKHVEKTVARHRKCIACLMILWVR